GSKPDPADPQTSGLRRRPHRRRPATNRQRPTVSDNRQRPVSDQPSTLLLLCLFTSGDEVEEHPRVEGDEYALRPCRDAPVRDAHALGEDLPALDTDEPSLEAQLL